MIKLSGYNFKGLFFLRMYIDAEHVEAIKKNVPSPSGHYSLRQEGDLLIFSASKSGPTITLRAKYRLHEYQQAMAEATRNTITEGFGATAIPDDKIGFIDGQMLIELSGWPKKEVVKRRKTLRQLATDMVPHAMATAASKEPVQKEAVPVPVPVINGPNPKIARRVYQLLDDTFDETTGLYARGYSDEMVAKELDVSIDLVVKTRREAYGELAEDPIVDELTESVNELRELVISTLQDFANRIDALDGKIEMIKTIKNFGR